MDDPSVTNGAGEERRGLLGRRRMFPSAGRIRGKLILLHTVFSLALATQNLVWGFAQPVFGMIADRMGEPVQKQRLRLGVWVLLFLAGFTVIAWRLNAAYWKDVK